MARADTPVAGSRVTALVSLGLLLAPHALVLARDGAAGAAVNCCVNRSCCCPPKAAPTPCHGRAAESAPIVRCHHPAPDATLSAIPPALVPSRVVADIRPAESPRPTPAAPAPRHGFGRIESPPPRCLEHA